MNAFELGRSRYSLSDKGEMPLSLISGMQTASSRNNESKRREAEEFRRKSGKTTPDAPNQSEQSGQPDRYVRPEHRFEKDHRSRRHVH
jgi:hypothetical protein